MKRVVVALGALWLGACADGSDPSGGDPRCTGAICSYDAFPVRDAVVDRGVPAPDGSPPDQDAASVGDAEPPAPDGAPPRDAAPPVPDGALPMDAAPLPVDAAPDAEPPPMDAAPSHPDVAPPPDAAPPVDARPPPVDTEPPPVDALPPPVDALPPPVDALPDVELDAAPDALVDAAEPVDDAFVPPPTPPPGIYDYRRLQIGRLGEVARVAFHPAGGRYVAAERYDVVHVVDWATGADTRLEVVPGGNRHVYWSDVKFEPGGAYALLVGREIGANNADPRGVAYRLDLDPEPVLTPYDDIRLADETISAVAWPWEGGLPILLAKRRVGQGYNAILRELDPEAGGFTPFIAARVSGAGCDDLAFADNEWGEPGILVVCGENGADTLYYTWLAGAPEWRADPGNNNLGNTSSVAAHPEGDYALVVSWSGRSIYRFQAGLLNGYNDAPRYATLGISRVVFQEDGRRALIVGRASVAPVSGTVIEYRHDEYRCPNVAAADCALTNVSIPGYDSPPYNGTSNYRLNDAAFHPGCDGGIIGGGFSDFQGSTGHLIRFRILNGRPCPGGL